jgi:hypothetical protein
MASFDFADYKDDRSQLTSPAARLARLAALEWQHQHPLRARLVRVHAAINAKLQINTPAQVPHHLERCEETTPDASTWAFLKWQTYCRDALQRTPQGRFQREVDNLRRDTWIDRWGSV